MRITERQLRRIIIEEILEEDVRRRGNKFCAYVDDKLTRKEKEANPKLHKGKKVGSVQRTASGKIRMKARACYASKKKANNAMAAAMMEEILREGDVVPMDFRSKAVRARFKPGVADVFIFSGDAGQIARVVEMQRDESSPSGGVVFYEQYIEDKDEPGVWVQEPAKVLEKGFTQFISRYYPFKGTIEHLQKVKDEEAEDEIHMERVMSDEGFPDYKSYDKYPKEVMASKEYINAFKKAMSTMPSVKRTLSHHDRD